MRKTQNKKCYMCNAEATTKEHVPPKSFFPPSCRENLITVPACASHNNDNSKDVEYVSSFIGSPIQTKEVGREQFNKALRAFKRNPNLKKLIFKDVQRIMLANGQETGLVKLDMDRFKSIMKAIAYALYFYNFGKTFIGGFNIFGTNLISTKQLPPEASIELDKIRSMLSQVNFIEMKMPQPEVFKCGIYQENDHSFIFEFVFYGGFTVHAVSIPFYFKLL